MVDMRKTVGEHFDEWAPSYDAQIREMVPRYEEINETILALLALRPPSRFLDLGAGTGYTLRRVLEKSGVAIKLTDREQDILSVFAQRAGETIPRHELVGDGSEVGERTIDVQINRLRRKIERDPANPVWLQTVRGVGYRLSVE